MKKLTTIALLAAAMSFVACSSSDKKAEAATDAAKADAAATATKAPAAAPAKKAPAKKK